MCRMGEPRGDHVKIISLTLSGRASTKRNCGFVMMACHGIVFDVVSLQKNVSNDIRRHDTHVPYFHVEIITWPTTEYTDMQIGIQWYGAAMHRREWPQIIWLYHALSVYGTSTYDISFITCYGAFLRGFCDCINILRNFMRMSSRSKYKRYIQ